MWWLLKSKKQTNIQKIKEMSADKMAEYMGNEVYAIFKFSLTKKEFIEKLNAWLNAKVEERGEKKNDKLYEYDVRA